MPYKLPPFAVYTSSLSNVKYNCLIKTFFVMQAIWKSDIHVVVPVWMNIAIDRSGVD